MRGQEQEGVASTFLKNLCYGVGVVVTYGYSADGGVDIAVVEAQHHHRTESASGFGL